MANEDTGVVSMLLDLINCFDNNNYVSKPIDLRKMRSQSPVSSVCNDMNTNSLSNCVGRDMDTMRSSFDTSTMHHQDNSALNLSNSTVSATSSNSVVLSSNVRMTRSEFESPESDILSDSNTVISPISLDCGLSLNPCKYNPSTGSLKQRNLFTKTKEGYDTSNNWLLSVCSRSSARYRELRRCVLREARVKLAWASEDERARRKERSYCRQVLLQNMTSRLETEVELESLAVGVSAAAKQKLSQSFQISSPPFYDCLSIDRLSQNFSHINSINEYYGDGFDSFAILNNLKRASSSYCKQTNVALNKVDPSVSEENDCLITCSDKDHDCCHLHSEITTNDSIHDNFTTTQKNDHLTVCYSNNKGVDLVVSNKSSDVNSSINCSSKKRLFSSTLDDIESGGDHCKDSAEKSNHESASEDRSNKRVSTKLAEICLTVSLNRSSNCSDDSKDGEHSNDTNIDDDIASLLSGCGYNSNDFLDLQNSFHHFQHVSSY